MCRIDGRYTRQEALNYKIWAIRFEHAHVDKWLIMWISGEMATPRAQGRCESDMPRVNEEKQLTPFAEALQDWMFHEHRIPWSRPRLAAEAGLPASTINGWFRDIHKKPSMPEPEALGALLRVTGWSPEKLMELTGYTEWPAAVASESEYIREFMERSPILTDQDREKFGRVITEAMAEYHSKPKRPPRQAKAKSSQAKNEQPAPAREVTMAGK